MQSQCTHVLDAYAVYCRLNDTDSGDLSAATLEVIPDVVLQPDKHFKLQKPKASEDQQSQRGKLAPLAPADDRPCHKREKREKDTNLQGQVKSKNKKKNRLGQRARQQLGRAKQVQLGELRPKKTFVVSHTSL